MALREDLDFPASVLGPVEVGGMLTASLASVDMFNMSFLAWRVARGSAELERVVCKLLIRFVRNLKIFVTVFFGRPHRAIGEGVKQIV